MSHASGGVPAAAAGTAAAAPWPAGFLSEYVLRNTRLVTVDGLAGQLGAAAIASRAVRAGITILRASRPFPEVVDPILEEALFRVALPTDFMHLELLVWFPPDSSLAVAQLHQHIVSFTHSRVSAWLAQLNGLPLPATPADELLVPREEVLSVATAQQPQRVGWREPLVRHSLNIQLRPSVNFGPTPPPVIWPLPATGPEFNDDMTAPTTLTTVGAHALLFFALERMWAATDERCPIFLARSPPAFRQGLAVVDAFNVFLLYETELSLLRHLEREPAFEGEHPHGRVATCRRLDGFRRFALDALELSVDDAEERDHPSAVFFAWTIEQFGTAEKRARFAQFCAMWLRNFWPSISNESPPEGRRDRLNAIVARFERAFERVRELANPIEGPGLPIHNAHDAHGGEADSRRSGEHARSRRSSRT
ncbi:hypothetical protein JCM10450v2_006206 [Rhodotorula kratochvilovae]